MTRISKRLKAITEFLNINDELVDVGCDHGLLGIYLIANNLVKRVIASDVNQNALNSAIENIKKRNLNIETILSDGIKNIDLTKINTLVISGMGTGTILHILEDDKKLAKIKKIVIQSNNDHKILRENLNNKGYYLEKEIYTLDRNKWYVTCKFIKSKKKNNLREINYGFLDNHEYNEYLLDKKRKIWKKIPVSSTVEKMLSLIEYNRLRRAIKFKDK